MLLTGSSDSASGTGQPTFPNKLDCGRRPAPAELCVCQGYPQERLSGESEMSPCGAWPRELFSCLLT